MKRNVTVELTCCPHEPASPLTYDWPRDVGLSQRLTVTVDRPTDAQRALLWEMHDLYRRLVESD